MAARLSGTDLQSHLNILIASGVVGHLTDGQILRRFLSDDHRGSRAAARLSERDRVIPAIART